MQTASSASNFRTKKHLFILAFVVLFIGSCVHKPTTLRVWTNFAEGNGNYRNYLDAVAAAQIGKDFTVEDLSVPADETSKAELLGSFSAGKEPDVLFTFTGADVDDLVKDNQFVPIEEIRTVYPDYAENMRQSMLPVSHYDGRQYAVPVNGYWEALFYNREILESCGVKPPDENTDWDEFLEICAAVRAHGFVPIAASLFKVPHYWFEYLVFNAGSIENHGQLPSESAETAARWESGLNAFKNLYDCDFFPENTLTASDDETAALFQNGQAAFLLDGSWKVDWLREGGNGDRFGVTFVPGSTTRKSASIVSGLSQGYCITRKAWNNRAKQAACVDFITSMTADDVVAKFGATSVTALKAGVPPLEDADALTRDALNITKKAFSFTSAVQDSLTPEDRARLFDAIPSVVMGKTTPAEAIAPLTKGNG